MSKSKIVNFKIESDIDYVQINKFIDYYYNYIECTEPLIIEFTAEESEVDAVFLSYLILFLTENPNKEIHFVVPNKFDYGRIESLKFQLGQILQTLNSNKIKLYKKIEKVDSNTGEVFYNIRIDYLSDYRITESKSFIPPLYISKKENLNYFGKINEENDRLLFPLYDKYLGKLIDEIKRQISEEKHWGNQDKELQKLKLNELSFIELTLFRLLLNNDIYEKKNVGTIAEKGETKSPKEKVHNRHKKRIRFYRNFVEELSDGLFELAKNIKEHSSKGKGVITARLFDKKRLLKLKDSSIETFLNERNSQLYKIRRTEKNKIIEKQYFLDINVVDLSNNIVREKYIENIKKNNDEIRDFSSENYQNDIALISNKDQFEYKDFFVIDIEKISRVKHQQNKLISRIGLHYFTNILKDKTDSFIKTSSIKYSKKEKLQNTDNENKDGVIFYNDKNGNEIVFTNEKGKSEKYKFIKGGTTFNCIVPIKINGYKEDDDEYSPDDEIKESTNINTFEKLSNYEIVDYKQIKNKGKTPIYRYSERVDIPANEESKYYNIFKIYNDIKNVSDKNKIICIDAKGLNLSNIIGNINEQYDRSESDWIRLLSALNYYYKDIIVYNINKEEVKRILNIRKSWWSKRLPFWNLDSRVLFYSIKKSNDNKYQRFGATILVGETEEHYNILNTNIGHHHYNFGPKEKFYPKNIDSKKKLPKKIYGDNLFHKGNLKYFELLITNEDKDKSNISLFEESVQYSLNTDYKPNIKETNNKGYKISNTHFRLGSKIHISDFFYGKRLFQNSFFTTPLAYRLAHNIIDNKKYFKPNRKYSIIGYDKYSDFLVSTVRNILEKQKLKNVEINNFTISKDGKLSRDRKSLHANTIIIVPIASTFSTSIKIKKDIDKIFERLENGKKQEAVLYQNIILVADSKSMNTSKSIIEIDNNHFLSDFKWKTINKTLKTVDVSSFDEQHTKQKYFIPLFTNWEMAYDCQSCFPENGQENEKCLIETGSASVTPKLIFGYPKTKKPNSNGNNKLDLKDSLLYGNLKNRNNNYLYFTKTASIINKRVTDNDGNYIKKDKKYVCQNRENIINWLKSLKKVFRRHQNKKIVIVTPTSGSKSNFLDLVNEHLFEFTANCIFISLEEDYIENAEFLYSDGLHKASIVVYVDDVLSTIKAFLEVNYIVKYIRDKPQTGKGIDYCISLINRMSYDNENNIILKLVPLDRKFKLSKGEKRLLYFTKINNPSIEEPNNEFPLQKERKRYKLLSTISSLDYIRNRFNTKRINLKANDLSEELSYKLFDHLRDSKYKKLNQLLVLNSIYSLFNYNNNHTQETILKEIFENGYDFDLLEEKINEKLQFEPNEHKKDVIEKYKDNRKYTILKIICSTPLIYYKEIREASFVWINKELIAITKQINSYDENNFIEFFQIENNISYSNFQNLKFLLKRSVELKSNYILSEDFFNAIKKLINLLNKKPRFYEDSENYTFIKLQRKFNETKSLKFKSEIFKFIRRNRDNIQSENYKLFLQDIKPKEEKILLKGGINLETSNEDIDEIQRFLNSVKFKCQNNISSKKLIYYLISLVQELILEHETKSVKLEKNINPFIGIYEDRCDIERYRLFLENNKNGNFLHYLRLLKLENTEIAYKFWEQHKIENTKGQKNKTIDNIIVEEYYKFNPKYQLLIENNLVDKSSYQAYFDIKTHLHNIEFENKNGKIAASQKETKRESKITKDIQKILEKCNTIIGNVEESYLTVNYNKIKGQINKGQLYTFNNKNNVCDSLIDLDDTLTLEMFNINKNNSNIFKSELSNFEVYKNTTDDIEPRYREGFLNKDKKDILEYNECKKFRNKIYSILLIRISDFYRESENADKDKLYTQAVFTFYLKKGERLAEEKMRLLLLLRKSLSTYLKNQTTNNTFLELLKYDEKNKHISHLKHSIGKFTNHQLKLYNEINVANLAEKWDKYISSYNMLEQDEIKKHHLKFKIQNFPNNSKIFELITNSIKGQTGASIESINDNDNILNADYLKDITKTILVSNYFGSKELDYDEKIFTSTSDFEIIKIPYILDTVIIPELIVNMKKHGENFQIYWNNSPENLDLVFRNDRLNAKTNSGFGSKMCKELCERLETISLSPPKKDENTYEITLTIKKI